MEFQKDIEAMNALQYKRYHESFMQNNHGSSAAHVFFCIFFTVQCSVYASLRLRTCKSATCATYLSEYLIIVLPLTLAHTVLSDYVYFLNIIIIAMVLFEFYKQLPKDKSSHENELKSNKKIYSISIMRGLTYIITVFAILAVDFRDFPRHLAKTEKYGYSLMDTGVGLFVLMSGLVHKDLQNHSFLDIIRSNIKFIVVLVSLGVARYVSVKQLDYHEHVTEYGVHWNFFFTIAVCKLLSTVILYFNINALYYSFILLFSHEMILYVGVQDWVFSDVPRDSLVSANREGLSSCLGYVSLYLFAAHVKKMLIKKSSPNKRKENNNIFIINKIQMLLVMLSVGLWTFLFVSNSIRPISRTLANASYCIFLEATLMTVVSILYFMENALQNGKYTLQEPKIIQNVNSNGLSYFLIANLLTGAVNLTMRTLTVSSVVTFCILNIYMIIILYAAMLLKAIGIKI